MKKSEKLVELDFFRSIAILLVFFYHFYVVVGASKITTGISFLDTVFLTGWIGVDLFFVLSGFLLTYSIYKSIKNKSFSLKKYFQRRFLRIAPAYYLALFISLIITPIYFTSPSGLLNIGAHLLFIHNFWRNFHGGILGVGWTLGIEMQFYLLVPFLVMIFFKKLKNTLFFLLLALLISWGYRYFLFENYYETWDFWNKFIFTDQLIGRIDQFALGGVSAFIFLKKKAWIYKSKITSSFIFLLFCGLFFIWIQHFHSLGENFWKNKNEVIFAHTTLGLIFSILILSAFNLPSFFHEIFSKKIFLYTAKLSYGFYLWHLIIMNQIKTLPIEIFSKLIISISLTFLLAIISYTYIEKPFLKK